MLPSHMKITFALTIEIDSTVGVAPKPALLYLVFKKLRYSKLISWFKSPQSPILYKHLALCRNQFV